MNTDAVQRYARQISLPEVGPDGQERICAARVAVVGDDLAAEIAALYLGAAGVGTVIPIRIPPPNGPAWLEALADADGIVRSGFDDDAMAGVAARLGLPVVVVRDTLDRVDVVAFPRRPPDPEAPLALPRQAATPAPHGAGAVLAGTLAAAELLLALTRDPAGGPIRNLRLPLDGGDPQLQEIGGSR